MAEPIVVGGGQDKKGDRKRLFLLAGLGVGLLVVAFLVPKFLFSSGDAEVTIPESLPVASPNTPTTVPAPEGDQPPETFEVFSTKNPFTPLISTTDDAGQAPDGSSDIPPDDGATEPPPDGSTDSTLPETTQGNDAPEPPTSGSQRVELWDVYTNEQGSVVASVRVNDTMYEVVEGQTFASSYQAVSLSVEQGCGQFLYGDDQFELCRGEQLLK